MAERMKKPVEKGVAKVPVVMQLEALECGAASLCMILAYYNKWIPLEQVREDCGVSRDGSNARNVLKAARFYGLEAKGYRYEPETLKTQGKFPCIIHWNFNHFVVLNGFKGGKAYLNDPAKGTYSVPMDTFDDSFTGICLQFEPTDAFTPSGKQKSMLSFAAKRLKGTGAAMAFTVLTGIVAALMGLVQPAFSRVFLDHLLTGKDLAWATGFLLFLGAFNLIQIIMSALQAVYSLRINGKMAAVGNASYMWKVLKMPMKFFSQRMAGDIQGRQGSNATIANTLIGTFAPLLLNVVIVKLPVADTFELTPAKEELLSQIIAEINSKTGKDYDNDVIVKTILQIIDIMSKSEALKTSAKHNTEKDFEFSFFDGIDDALIEGLSQNQDFCTLLLQNEDMKKQVLGIYAPEVYKKLKEES